MKITHLMLWFKDGLSYQENYLPRIQAQYNNEVTIVCTAYFPSVDGFEVVNDSEKTNSAKVIRLNSVSLGPLSTQRLFIGLKKVLETTRPDIIHSHGIFTLPTFLSLLFKAKFNYRLFVDDHNDKENFSLNIFQRLFYHFINYFLMKMFINKVDKFLPVNPYSRFFLENILQIPEEKIENLPLGLDNEFFYADSSEGNEIRRKLNIDEKDFVFVTSGRLEKLKKIEVLISAFAKLIITISRDSKLIIIGRGDEDYVKMLRELTKSFGIMDNVIFQDWLSQQDLRKYYNASNVAVMPGKMSGIKDAICCGLPIIVSDELPTKYLVSDINGLCFNANDSEDLFKKMEKYILDPDILKNHSYNALNCAVVNLNWFKISEESIRIYRKK